jgi:hypothetical protein
MAIRLSELYIIGPGLRDKLMEQAKKSGGWQSMCAAAVARPLLQPDEKLGVFRHARKQFLKQLREEVDAELSKPEYR